MYNVHYATMKFQRHLPFYSFDFLIKEITEDGIKKRSISFS